MDTKIDFLSALRSRPGYVGDSTGSLRNLSGLKVVVDTSLSGATLLYIKDNKGKLIEPSSIVEHHSAIGRLAKGMAGVNRRDPFSFDWSGKDIPDSIVVEQHPYLMSLVAECGSIVNQDDKPVSVNKGVVPLCFRLGDAMGSSGDSRLLKGDFYVNDVIVERFLSDEYLLAANTIHHINSVGDRFADFHAFSNPFRAELLESFLSILYSTVSAFHLEYKDLNVRRSGNMASEEPLIVFEKVDEDNSLYMRVTMSVGSLPFSITDNFELSYAVSVSDTEIVVREVEPYDVSALFEDVKEKAIRNAPSRAEAKEIWAEGNLLVIPHEVAGSFIFNVLPQLLNSFKVIGAEKLKSYKITAARPKLNLRLSSGIDFLEGKADVEIEGEKFTINELLSQYTKNKYITLSDGNRAVIDDKYIGRLQRIFRRERGKSGNVEISFFDLPEVMDLLEGKSREGAPFKAYNKFYKGFNALQSARLSVPGLKARLRGYQKEGVKWINYLYDMGMGGCLADDMGLGKTVQTIAALCKSVKKTELPSLIIMPRSLLFNWEEEFARFAPEIRVATYYGLSRDPEDAMKAQVILTSYAVVRNDIEKLSSLEFDYIILDESQNIKNVDAMTTKAVWLLKSRHRLAISGTPIENNLSELYSLFHFLNPAMFGSLKDFNEQYATPIQKNDDEDAAKALRRKIFPFMLRRLKKDVLTDLPDRTEQTLIVEMSERQAALYEERRKYYQALVDGIMGMGNREKARFELLRALGELRQIASIPEEKSDGAIPSPKIELLVDSISQAVDNGHKVVAFFNFLAGIEFTGERLSTLGIDYEVMTGATTDRKKVVDRFQNDPMCKVLLMTVKTGGVGLNLTNADTVFIVEPWWNKAAEEQAVNRLHRIGQKQAVNCYYLITSDSIEEKIRQLQEKKSALVDAVISSDTSGKTLSDDDISFLLSK